MTLHWIAAGIGGIGVWGPGLEGWVASHPVLAGTAPWLRAPSSPPPPTILSPTERRRSGLVVRLALAVATEAAANSGLQAASLRAVFASAHGDGHVVGHILETLSGAEQLVSPTQFHNSVHNAAAGYWSIGIGSDRPAACLGAYQASFAAALLTAMAEVATQHEPVLLCAYDAPMPWPARSDTSEIFGVALVLLPDGQREGAPRLRVAYAPGPGVGPQSGEFSGLAEANPAARALPLLRALARDEAADFALPWLDGRLEVRLSPCSKTKS